MQPLSRNENDINLIRSNNNLYVIHEPQRHPGRYFNFCIDEKFVGIPEDIMLVGRNSPGDVLQTIITKLLFFRLLLLLLLFFFFSSSLTVLLLRAMIGIGRVYLYRPGSRKESTRSRWSESSPRSPKDQVTRCIILLRRERYFSSSFISGTLNWPRIQRLALLLLLQLLLRYIFSGKNCRGLLIIRLDVCPEATTLQLECCVVLY